MTIDQAERIMHVWDGLTYFSIKEEDKVRAYIKAEESLIVNRFEQFEMFMIETTGDYTLKAFKKFYLSNKSKFMD